MRCCVVDWHYNSARKATEGSSNGEMLTYVTPSIPPCTMKNNSSARFDAAIRRQRQEATGCLSTRSLLDRVISFDGVRHAHGIAHKVHHCRHAFGISARCRCTGLLAVLEGSAAAIFDAQGAQCLVQPSELHTELLHGG